MDFHRFMWEHHVGGLPYAKTYEIAHRFGAEKLRPSRAEFFDHLCAHLRQIGVAPEKDVKSVFDVGCSLGYALRFLETEKFPAATCLRGIDVDQYAIKTGNAYLRQLGSKIELSAGDVSALDAAMGDLKYDVVLCCGVLMYLDEDAAARAIQTMLAHTRRLLGVISLANPGIDNINLVASYARPADQGFVHNVAGMVRQAGGRVVFRKWTDPEQASRFSLGTPLFTLAQPGPTSNS